MTESKKKIKNLAYHSKWRSQERHDLYLTATDRNAIVHMVNERKSSLVRKVSNTRTIHRVFYKGKDLHIVYDKSRHAIVTVLPEENDVT